MILTGEFYTCVKCNKDSEVYYAADGKGYRCMWCSAPYPEFKKKFPWWQFWNYLHETKRISDV